ncbi:hypothetical protein Dimus_039760 [Dionaea muscipula]
MLYSMRLPHLALLYHQLVHHPSHPHLWMIFLPTSWFGFHRRLHLFRILHLLRILLLFRILLLLRLLHLTCYPLLFGYIPVAPVRSSLIRWTIEMSILLLLLLLLCLLLLILIPHYLLWFHHWPLICLLWLPHRPLILPLHLLIWTFRSLMLEYPLLCRPLFLLWILFLFLTLHPKPFLPWDGNGPCVRRWKPSRLIRLVILFPCLPGRSLLTASGFLL